MKEKVAKLTKKIPLTDKEKLVFYGLVKYSLLNDHQLSKRLKIKRSTITAVKNKLKKQNFYSTYAIPNFESIGCELMCIVKGESPVGSIEERKKLGIINKIINSPEVIFDIGTDKEFLGIIVSRNFVEIKKLMDYVSAIYENSTNGTMEPPHFSYFPFEMSNIIKFFDYSALIKSLFSLNVKEENGKTIKSIKRELTSNEKIILYALTKYPDLTETGIAAKTRISRQTVSQIKNSLINDNFLKIVNIPDVRKLNCELLAYSYGKIDSGNIDKQKEVPSVIFRIHTEREDSSIFIFEDYTMYKAIYGELISNLKQRGVITDEPKICLIPINQIKFQKMDFAPLVKKILELKVVF